MGRTFSKRPSFWDRFVNTLLIASLVVAPCLAGPQCCCGRDRSLPGLAAAISKDHAVCGKPVEKQSCCHCEQHADLAESPSRCCLLGDASHACSRCRTCQEQGCQCGRHDELTLRWLSEPKTAAWLFAAVEVLPASLACETGLEAAYRLTGISRIGNARQALLCVWRN